jgi:hypothetical protein
MLLCLFPLHYPVDRLSTRGLKTCLVPSGSSLRSLQKPRQVSIMHMERIWSKRHVLVCRNVYVHCSTIDRFYTVFKAAKALIDVIQNRAKEAYPPDNLRPVRLLVYIDESHEMTTDKQTLRDDGRNAYQTLCSSLNELLKLDLFFVFLSTNSNLQEYSPSPRIFWSKRGRNSTLAYVQTPYTELPFDIWARQQLVAEGRHTVDVVCEVKFMVRFGRPLCVHLIWNFCDRGLN